MIVGMGWYPSGVGGVTGELVQKYSYTKLGGNYWIMIFAIHTITGYFCYTYKILSFLVIHSLDQ